MSDRLAHFLTVEIWPASVVRLPLWVRVAVCLGWVPVLCMVGLLLAGPAGQLALLRQTLVLTAVVYPPLAAVTLGVSLAVKYGARRREALQTGQTI
jgi:hypothetical protein